MLESCIVELFSKYHLSIPRNEGEADCVVAARAIGLMRYNAVQEDVIDYWYGNFVIMGLI